MDQKGKPPLLHKVPDNILQIIHEMDTQIGEYMQERADVVNQIIKELAVFEPGDFVKIYAGDKIIAYGKVLQPLFIKKLGIVAYRIRTIEGEEFTNNHYHLEKTTQEGI
jgi:hypothetical protein